MTWSMGTNDHKSRVDTEQDNYKAVAEGAYTTLTVDFSYGILELACGNTDSLITYSA